MKRMRGIGIVSSFLLIGAFLAAVPALAEVEVYTDRADWEAKVKSFLCEDFENEPLDEGEATSTPYTTVGGTLLATINAPVDLQYFYDAYINGTKAFHFRDYGEGVRFIFPSPVFAFGFDYDTAWESFTVTANGVSTELPGNQIAFIGYMDTAPIVFFDLVGGFYNGAQGGITFDNLCRGSGIRPRHESCYEVNGPEMEEEVFFTDQFGTKHAMVKKAVLLCNSADKCVPEPLRCVGGTMDGKPCTTEADQEWCLGGGGSCRAVDCRYLCGNGEVEDFCCEQCEADGDCPAGTVCSGCECILIPPGARGATVAATTQAPILDGIPDDFASPTEPASPSPGLQLRLDPPPGRPLQPFDSIIRDRQFAHTIRDLPPDICAAELEIRAKPLDLCSGTDSPNDTIELSFTDEAGNLDPVRWRRYFGTPNYQSTQKGLLKGEKWCKLNVNVKDGVTFNLNLARLDMTPGMSPSLETNLLRRMRLMGFLDIIVQDDTAVDYVKLTYELCEHSLCYEVKIITIPHGTPTQKGTGDLSSQVQPPWMDGEYIDLRKTCVTDQFGTRVWLPVWANKPDLLCTPAEKCVEEPERCSGGDLDGAPCTGEAKQSCLKAGGRCYHFNCEAACGNGELEDFCCEQCDDNFPCPDGRECVNCKCE